jgi:TrmH family RNA methyltransferase
MPLPKADFDRVRALREKKPREASGLYVVEGPKVVAELLAAGTRFEAIYATTAWSPPGDPISAPLSVVTATEMARLSHYPTPSPVLALGRLTRATLAPGELATGFTLALDGIQDPGNVGTLLRIADWFGFARVLLSPDCADLFSQKVINASMGSFARIRVITTELAPALTAAAVPVLGCDLAGTPLATLARPPAAVVVIGSEGRGLSPAVAATLTERVTIPRFGGAESLNAAVAAGIVCAHLRLAATP